jgi:hypothetical protein
MRGAGLAVFFLFVVFVSSCMGAQQPEGDKAAKGSVKKQPSEVVDVKLAETIMMAPSYPFTYDRDPFRPLVEDAQAEAAFPPCEGVPGEDVPLLRGIISSGGVSRALINIEGKTKLYKEKEMVGPYLLEKIDLKRIMLKRDEEQLELKVGGGLKQ